MEMRTPYDDGYESICPVGASWEDAGSSKWGVSTLILQLGWLAAQLRLNPRDQFRWGRFDAMCDLLIRQDGCADLDCILDAPIPLPSKTIV
jgi:hypothetical protein